MEEEEINENIDTNSPEKILNNKSNNIKSRDNLFKKDNKSSDDEKNTNTEEKNVKIEEKYLINTPGDNNQDSKEISYKINPYIEDIKEEEKSKEDIYEYEQTQTHNSSIIKVFNNSIKGQKWNDYSFDN